MEVQCPVDARDPAGIGGGVLDEVGAVAEDGAGEGAGEGDGDGNEAGIEEAGELGGEDGSFPKAVNLSLPG